MSQAPFIPPKPVEITLDTLPQLFAHNRARFGGWSMTQTPPENDPPQDPAPPERPEGISDEEWNALGDPGRAAIVRERGARQAAERQLAAARARPAAPPKKDPPQDPQNPGGKPASDPGQSPDLASIVQQAVAAAVQPFVERDQQREVQQAAEKVQQAVLDAAKPLLHDETDALAGIDLTTVVDDQGRADTEKVKTALADLVTRKPHLAKAAPGTPRQAPIGIGGGGPAGVGEGEKVKAVLADMQRATGVRPPTAPSTTH